MKNENTYELVKCNTIEKGIHLTIHDDRMGPKQNSHHKKRRKRC